MKNIFIQITFSLATVGTLFAQTAPEVSRSYITTAIEDLEPVDDLDSVSTDIAKVYYFTELKNMDGMTATHRWVQGGEVRAEVHFKIKGSHWRAFSSKNMNPAWTGEWILETLDSLGSKLHEDVFYYGRQTRVGAVVSEPESHESTKATSPPDTVVAAKNAESGKSIRRAIFTTAIEEREPVDEIIALTSSTESIFFFTEILGMKGETVIHRWLLGDQQIADVSFDVKGPRWRVYSSKKLGDAWVGALKVQVIDSTGAILAEKAVTFTK